MTDDEKIVSLSDHLPQPRAQKPPRQAELNCARIRDLSVKAVIYPGSILPKEAQELGAAILFHLKQYYGYSDPS